MEKKEIETPKPFDNEQEVIQKKYKIIKYPFSGVAPNLIDKFLVLGYEQKTIDNTIKFYEDTELQIKLNTLFKIYDFQERPSIINEICYNYSKELIETDLILEIIFPNLPKMYFLDKEYINMKNSFSYNDELLLSPYSIIFSINPIDNFNSKKSYNGLAYIFYVRQEYRNIYNEIEGLLYYPAAYVILSEFPYFYHFKEICLNVYMQMNKENEEIPIEIILYNLVKYCPSPINKTIYLSFEVDINRIKMKK